MTVVVDASVLVAAMVDSGREGTWAESAVAEGALAGPQLALAEATNILRRLERAGDIIVAPAQSSREGSAGIRVRARNARLTQGTGPVETAAAVQMGMVAFGRLSLDHFHRCLQKPPQKTLPAFAQLHTGRRRFITIILERTKTGKTWTLKE